MQKTFYHFLPEAGRPLLKKASDMDMTISRIEALKKALKTESDTLFHLSTELWQTATDNWTPEEIETAKRLRSKQQKEGGK